MIEYTVHSCHETELPMQVDVRGRKGKAYVPSLIVELVQDEEDAVGDPHGHTFRLSPETEKEMEKLKNLFEPGARIKATFSVVRDKASDGDQKK